MGLTRSTVGDEPVDPRSEALNDVLHWIWSWHLQGKRLLQTTDGQGQGDSELARRRSYSAASYDEHALAVVGGHIARAVERAAKHFPTIALAEQQSEPLRLLRNLYEHWDEQREAFQSKDATKRLSGKAFSEKFPEGRPWSITYTADDWLLGGVVGLNALSESLQQIETEVLKLEVSLPRAGRSKDRSQ